MWLLKVGDGDDDQQVERGREQRDKRQQRVNGAGVRARTFPAGAVEMWKAELSLLHPQTAMLSPTLSYKLRLVRPLM